MTIESFSFAVLGGVITLFGNSILEKIRAKSSLTSEQYKIQLKKSEFFFEKQFDASLEFGKFFYELLPKKQSVFDEWEDAMSWLADDLQNHQKFLDDFISKYNILFSDETLDILRNCSYKVTRMNDDKDEHDINGQDEMSWQDKKWSYADEFYKELENANKSIRNEIKEQVKI